MPRFSSSFMITLDPQETMTLKTLVSEEIAFFNGILSSISGPMRTQPKTFEAFTGAYEELFSEVARLGLDTYRIKPDMLDEGLAVRLPFRKTNGVLDLDPKVRMILDAAARPSRLHPLHRKAIASEMIAEARQQSSAYANTSVFEGEVYRHAIEIMSPYDPRSKRHTQIPRSACTVTKDKDKVEIKLPYFARTFAFNDVHGAWSIVILKEENGRHFLELSHENVSFVIRRTDPILKKRKRRVKS